MFYTKVCFFSALALASNVLAINANIKYEARWVDAQRRTRSVSANSKIENKKVKPIVENMIRWTDFKYKAEKVGCCSVTVTNSVRAKTRSETDGMIAEMQRIVAAKTQDIK